MKEKTLYKSFVALPNPVVRRKTGTVSYFEVVVTPSPSKRFRSQLIRGFCLLKKCKDKSKLIFFGAD